MFWSCGGFYEKMRGIFFLRVALKADETLGHSGEMQQIKLQRNKKHSVKENHVLEGVSLKSY